MINPSIWEDEHFGKLSDKAKILFIACISGADDDGRLSANISNLRAMAFRFEDIPLKEIQSLRSEIQEKMKNFKVYSVDGCDYIHFLKWGDHQTIRKDRHIPSNLPPCQPKDNQTTTTCQPNVGIREEKLREEKRSKDKGVFTPPTQEEVLKYCEERKNKVNALKFHSFYESKGWMVGKNSMKDWRAAVRTWEDKPIPKAIDPISPYLMPKPNPKQQEEVAKLIHETTKNMK